MESCKHMLHNSSEANAITTKQQWSEIPDKRGLQLVQLKTLHQKNKCHRLFCIKNRHNKRLVIYQTKHVQNYFSMSSK